MVTPVIALFLSLNAAVPGESPPARTAVLATTISIRVRSAVGCVAAADLMARVAARATRLEFTDTEPTLAVDATFTREPTGAVTTVVLMSGPSGKTMSRRFRARSCLEAADAAALMIAVTLDPAAINESTTPEATSTVGPPGDGTRGTTRPPAPPTEQAAPDEVLAKRDAGSLPLASPVPDVAASLPPVGWARHRAGGRLSGLLVKGPAPVLMPGIGIYAVVAFDGDAIWSPEVVMGALRSWRAGLVELGGTASFVLEAASVDICLLRMRISLVAVRACASGLVGRISSSGAATANPVSTERPFAVVGGAAAFSAALGSRLELVARFGAGATLVRDWYLFGANQFHRADWLTIDGSLGIGILWP